MVNDSIMNLRPYLEQISQSQGALPFESPLAQATFNLLEVIAEWLNVHMNILERWESRKYFGFERIAQNASYSETLASILVINVPM